MDTSCNNFKTIRPNWDGLLSNIRREGTPDRIYFMEFGMANEILNQFDEYFHITDIDAEETDFKKQCSKKMYGDRLTLIGGLDVDFLSRSDAKSIREKVKEVIATCQPGGGFLFASGNWVTDYIPFQNYLVAIDEARNY